MYRPSPPSSSPPPSPPPGDAEAAAPAGAFFHGRNISQIDSVDPRRYPSNTAPQTPLSERHVAAGSYRQTGAGFSHHQPQGAGYAPHGASYAHHQPQGAGYAQPPFQQPPLPDPRASIYMQPSLESEYATQKKSPATSKIKFINQIYLRSGGKDQYVSQKSYASRIAASLDEFKQDIRNGYKNDFQLIVENDSKGLAYRVLEDSGFQAGQQTRVKIITPSMIGDTIEDYERRDIITIEQASAARKVLNITNTLASPWIRSDLMRTLSLVLQLDEHEGRQPTPSTSLYRDHSLRPTESVNVQNMSEQNKLLNQSILRSEHQTNMAYKVPVGANFYSEISLQSITADFEHPTDETTQDRNLYKVLNALEKQAGTYRLMELGLGQPAEKREQFTKPAAKLQIEAENAYNIGDIEKGDTKLLELTSLIQQYGGEIDSRAMVSDYNQGYLDRRTVKQKLVILKRFETQLEDSETLPAVLEGQKYLAAMPKIRNAVFEIYKARDSGYKIPSNDAALMSNYGSFRNILLAKYGNAIISNSDSMGMIPNASQLNRKLATELVDTETFKSRPQQANSGLWALQPEIDTKQRNIISSERIARALQLESNQQKLNFGIPPDIVESWVIMALNIKDAEIAYRNISKDQEKTIMRLFDQFITQNEL